MIEAIHDADVFFLVAAVAVALIGAELCVVLAYVTLILRDIKGVSARLGQEAGFALDDVGSVRQCVKDIIQRLRRLLGFEELP